MPMYDDLPESIKGMKDYLVKADQFKKVDPVVSVYCKVYALERGLKERDNADKAVMPFIMQLMDQVEAEKKELGAVEDAQAQVEDMALKLFNKGDNQYRAGKADMNTVKTLRAAATIFEVVTQFCADGELPFDLSEKYTYAKVKAMEIFKCLKEGKTPVPPQEIDEFPMPPPDHPPPGGGAAVPGMSVIPGVPDVGSAPPEPHDQPPAPAASAPPASAPAASAPPASAPRARAPRSKHSIEDMTKAEKHTKYALSAIQFSDVPEAVSNLKKALAILEGSS